MQTVGIWTVIAAVAAGLATAKRIILDEDLKIT